MAMPSACRASLSWPESQVRLLPEQALQGLGHSLMAGPIGGRAGLAQPEGLEAAAAEVLEQGASGVRVPAQVGGDARRRPPGVESRTASRRSRTFAGRSVRLGSPGVLCESRHRVGCGSCNIIIDRVQVLRYHQPSPPGWRRSGHHHRPRSPWSGPLTWSTPR